MHAVLAKNAVIAVLDVILIKTCKEKNTKTKEDCQSYNSELSGNI